MTRHSWMRATSHRRASMQGQAACNDVTLADRTTAGSSPPAVRGPGLEASPTRHWCRRDLRPVAPASTHATRARLLKEAMPLHSRHRLGCMHGVASRMPFFASKSPRHVTYTRSTTGGTTHASPVMAGVSGAAQHTPHKSAQLRRGTRMRPSRGRCAVRAGALMGEPRPNTRATAHCKWPATLMGAAAARCCASCRRAPACPDPRALGERR